MHSTIHDKTTYLCVRQHPELGLLVKVGVSNNPAKRCSNLGAKRVGPLLPHHAEGDLKRLLKAWRAWDNAGWFRTPPPIFGGASEWHLATPEVGRIIRNYIRSSDQP
jgi:hypothetical protein